MAVGCVVLAVGCAGQKPGGPTERVLTPADFARSQPDGGGAAPVAPPVTAPDTAGQAGPAAPAADASVARDVPPSTPGVSVAVDAMVGHVNGHAIYANRVFELIHDQLTTRGKLVSRQQFHGEARQAIAGQLQTIVIETLLLAEAEGALTEQQRFGLRYALAEQRKELIRKFGFGSAKVADEHLRREDSSLDEQIDEFRQRAIIENHTRTKLYPKINITRKDIVRHYRRNLAEYHPPPGRTIHTIRTEDADDAETIDQQLAEGRPFLQVAADPKLNRYNPDTQGLFQEAFEGDAIFGHEQLNAATVALAAGQHTPRIKVNRTFFWVCVTRISTGKVRTLEEVQPEIRRQLEVAEFRDLDRQYRARLFLEGSYDPVGPPVDPLGPMVAALLEVAMGRYALPR